MQEEPSYYDVFHWNIVSPDKTSLSPAPRSHHASVIYKDYLIILGGQTEEQKPCEEIVALNLKDLKWSTITPKGDSLKAAYGFATCLYDENKIIISGGMTSDNKPNSNIAIITISGINQLDMTIREIRFGSYANLGLNSHAACIYENKMYLVGKHQSTQGGNVGAGLFLNLQKGLADGDSSQKTTHLFSLDLRNFSLRQWEIDTRMEGPYYITVHQGYLYIFCKAQNTNSSQTYSSAVWKADLTSFACKRVLCAGIVPGPLGSGTHYLKGDKIYFFTDYLSAFNFSTLNWEMVGTSGFLPQLQEYDTPIFYKNAVIVVGGAKEDRTFDVYMLTLDLESQDQDYSLKKVPSASIEESLEDYFKNKILHDIVFKVEGQEISAHKSFIAAKCPYFAKMFLSNMKESQSSIIEVPEVKAKVFKALLEYLYRGSIQLNDENLTIDLFKLAEEYRLLSLRDLCEQKLSKGLRLDNALDMFSLAETYGAEEIRKSCILFIAQNKDAMNQSEGLEKLPVQLLVEVLKLTKFDSKEKTSNIADEQQPPSGVANPVRL